MEIHQTLLYHWHHAYTAKWCSLSRIKKTRRRIRHDNCFAFKFAFATAPFLIIGGSQVTSYYRLSLFSFLCFYRALHCQSQYYKLLSCKILDLNNSLRLVHFDVWYPFTEENTWHTSGSNFDVKDQKVIKLVCFPDKALKRWLNGFLYKFSDSFTVSNYKSPKHIVFQTGFKLSLMTLARWFTAEVRVPGLWQTPSWTMKIMKLNY